MWLHDFLVKFNTWLSANPGSVFRNSNSNTYIQIQISESLTKHEHTVAKEGHVYIPDMISCYDVKGMEMSP